MAVMREGIDISQVDSRPDVESVDIRSELK